MKSTQSFQLIEDRLKAIDELIAGTHPTTEAYGDRLKKIFERRDELIQKLRSQRMRLTKLLMEETYEQMNVQNFYGSGAKAFYVRRSEKSGARLIIHTKQNEQWQDISPDNLDSEHIDYICITLMRALKKVINDFPAMMLQEFKEFKAVLEQMIPPKGTKKPTRRKTK